MDAAEDFKFVRGGFCRASNPENKVDLSQRVQHMVQEDLKMCRKQAELSEFPEAETSDRSFTSASEVDVGPCEARDAEDSDVQQVNLLPSSIYYLKSTWARFTPKVALGRFSVYLGVEKTVYIAFSHVHVLLYLFYFLSQIAKFSTLI